MDLTPQDNGLYFSLTEPLIIHPVQLKNQLSHFLFRILCYPIFTSHKKKLLCINSSAFYS